MKVQLESTCPESDAKYPSTADTYDTDNGNDYPEGGLTAWLVVLGAWCAMIPSMGLLNSLAVLQAWLGSHDLAALPDSTTGWIFSVYAFCLFFCGAQTGPIFDTYDIHWLIVPGTVGLTASLIFMSLSTTFYQYLLSFSILGGISSSLLYQPSLSVIGHWFYKKRGLATGLACTAGGFGGVWMPLLILYLAPSIGFAWTLRIIAVISAIHGMLVCLLLRKRLPPNTAAGSSIDLKALLDTKYGSQAAGVVLIEFAIFTPITYICSYGLHSGMGFRNAYLLNVLLNVGAIPGRALPNYLADSFGSVNTMCVIAFMCMTLIFSMWLTAGGNSAITIAFTMLYGFFSGASVSLAPVCVGQVCRTEDYGKRNGTAYTLASFGTLIGVPIAGAILGQERGTYTGLIIFSGTSYAVALVTYLLSRWILSGWKLFQIC